MSSLLVSGFKNFPVSRIIIYITIAAPLIASLTATKYLYVFSYDPFIVEYRQFWRILTHQIAYNNESEVLVVIVLLYQFRALERLFSSHKYLSLISLCFIYNLIIDSLIIPINFYSNSTILNNVCTGPTAIIFALLVHYREHIPVIYKFEVYGGGDNKIIITDQFLLNLLSFQLAVSQGVKSLFSAIIGWILGAFIIRGLLPGKAWRLPFWKSIESYFNRPNPVDRIINETNREISPNPNESNNEENTETRPLTSQFLDTFRN